MVPSVLLSRYLPCDLLRQHGVPHVIWFEDAIAQHNAPTIIFDLYLLVKDPAAAADVLLKEGWTIAERAKTIGNAEIEPEQSITMVALSPPLEYMVCNRGDPKEPGTTVLLQADQWNFELEDHNFMEGDIPSLPSLLDALIDSQLDVKGNPMLRSYLTVMIAYLYGNAPQLKDPRFAFNLRKEHRQYHFEACAGGEVGTYQFMARNRDVRSKVRNGSMEAPVSSSSKLIPSGNWNT